MRQPEVRISLTDNLSDQCRTIIDTLDGIPQAHATESELDLTPEIAHQQLNHALRVYAKAASRPRKAQCWAYVSNLLWNARSDALRAGALKRGTDEYVFVSDRYNDAESRRSFGRTLEGFGHADVRV